MVEPVAVLVAFDARDESIGRALVTALQKVSIAGNELVVDGAGPGPVSVPPCSLIVAVFGPRDRQSGLLGLIELARQSDIPLIVARGRGALVDRRATDYAAATADAGYLAGRGAGVSALHARATDVMREVLETHADKPVAQAVPRSSDPDAAMVSRSRWDSSGGDQGMLSSPEPLRPRWIGARPSILDPLDPQELLRPRVPLPSPRRDPEPALPGDVGSPRNVREGAIQSDRANAPTPTQKPSAAPSDAQPADPQPGVRNLDAVHFGVTSPDCLAPRDAGIVDVWAFLASQRPQVLKAAGEEHREPVTTVTQGPVRIARGSVLHARLWFEDLDVPDPLGSIVWEGEVGKATFFIKAPAGVKPGPKRGRVTILMAGMPIARLACVTRIEVQPGPGVAPVARTRTSSFDAARRRTAFASYASRDRREVLGRVHGLEKAGVDVFMDVKSLRSGENYEARLLEEIASRDVFFLFWSKAARASQWVEKEWRFALWKRGADFIDPIPLVTPNEVPPPRELAETLHFGDWTLAYTSTRALAPRRWWQFWGR